MARISQVVLYQEVAERLRQKIYNSDLKPGEWIDEQALADYFGISRTPLREALKVLHSEGLLVLKPHKGCFVAELSEQDLDEIFPVMALLEGRCAYEAVRKAKPSDLKRLDDIHAQLEASASSEDVNAFYKFNYIFHVEVQKLARNNWLQKTAGDLRKLLRALRGRQLKLPGRVSASLAEHRQIMAAFRKGDPVEAETITYSHLMAQREALAAYESQIERTAVPKTGKRNKQR